MSILSIQFNNIIFDFEMNLEMEPVTYTSYNNTGNIIYYGDLPNNNEDINIYSSQNVNLDSKFIDNININDLLQEFCNYLINEHNFTYEIIELLIPIINNSINNNYNLKQSKNPITRKEFNNKLIHLIMSKKILKELNISKYPVCVICQDIIKSTKKFTKLNCNHIFHKTCICEWLTKYCNSPHCPYCRLNVEL